MSAEGVTLSGAVQQRLKVEGTLENPDISGAEGARLIPNLSGKEDRVPK